MSLFYGHSVPPSAWKVFDRFWWHIDDGRSFRNFKASTQQSKGKDQV